MKIIPKDLFEYDKGTYETDNISNILSNDRPDISKDS